MTVADQPAPYVSNALALELAHQTERIKSATVIAKALIEGKQAMADKPKLNLPNLAGVASAFDKLRHGIEARADKMLKRVEAIDAKADTVFKSADAKLDAHDRGLGEIDHYLDALDRVGNGFTEGSSESSGS